MSKFPPPDRNEVCPPSGLGVVAEDASQVQLRRQWSFMCAARQSIAQPLVKDEY